MRLIVICLVVVAVTLGGFMGYRLYDRHNLKQQAQTTAATLVSELNILQEAHPEAIDIINATHDEAFNDAFDFGGLIEPGEFKEDDYKRSALQRAWAKVQARPDDDRTKIVIYLLVKTNAVPIDGLQLPRNQNMEDAIRAASSDTTEG